MSLCAHCQTPIPPGEGKQYMVDQGTGHSPAIVLHKNPRDCAPVVGVRRTPR